MMNVLLASIVGVLCALVAGLAGHQVFDLRPLRVGQLVPPGHRVSSGSDAMVGLCPPGPPESMSTLPRLWLSRRFAAENREVTRAGVPARLLAG